MEEKLMGRAFCPATGVHSERKKAPMQDFFVRRSFCVAASTQSSSASRKTTQNRLLNEKAGFRIVEWMDAPAAERPPFAHSRRPRLGLGLLITGIALLWVCGAPLLAERSLRVLEVDPPASPLTGTGAGAIVVLSGGTYTSAPEYGSDTVGPWTLERLRYATRLYRQTSLPVLVTGGPTLGAHSSEAEQMRDALEQDFGTPVRWLEPTGMDTLENASASEKLLREEGITKILLVTHAWHMRRARLAFEHAGLQVVPAPMGFTTRTEDNPLALAVPSARGMLMTRTAWHELLGLTWYRIRFAFS
jgi:uncharacterized SAM-binding protein YcdF (DUF218 family)